MQITCEKCQGKFRIADEKIPENKVVNLTCPKCKKKIRVQGRLTDKTTETNVKPTGALPFEVLGDERTALLCCNIERSGKTIQKNLEEMGYKTVFATHSEDAIKMMRFHPFDIAVIDDAFDSDSKNSEHIYSHLKALPMSSRRNLFVAYISDNYRTNDHMGAYCQSVNLLLNREQISGFKTVIDQAIKERDSFYSVYSETIRKYA
jgi:predicted Zn finger-like uncharacterized protein